MRVLRGSDNWRVSFLLAGRLTRFASGFHFRRFHTRQRTRDFIYPELRQCFS